MLTETEIRELLKSSVSEKRYAHTIGVVETAEKLADIYGADKKKCHLAALLHDCAKGKSKAEMLELINAAGIKLLDSEADFEPILHAPAGAALAKMVYGVNDAEVLSAIRKHTIGGRDMSLVEVIIFVADFIEPNRKIFEGLSEVRKLAETDIYAAAGKCASLTAEYCQSQGHKVFVSA